MARKNQKYKKPRKNFPWLLVALGSGLLLLAAVLFMRGGAGGGRPSIKVDQDKIDYGFVKFGENRQFRLEIMNTGDGNLRFQEQPYIEVLEGC